MLELQATGLEPIGTWSVIDSLNLTRMVEIQLATNPYNGVFHLLVSNLTKERVATLRTHIMAMLVVEFSREGYKIRKVFG